MVRIISRSTSLQVEGTYTNIQIDANATADDKKDLTSANGSIYHTEESAPDNKTYIGSFSYSPNNTSINMNDGIGYDYLVEASQALKDFVTELKVQII